VNAAFFWTVVECLGWTLLHFLWQGLVIAALLAGGLRLLRNAAPKHRYLAGCFALLLLAAAPAITLNRVWQRNELPTMDIPAQNFVPDFAKVPTTRDQPPSKFIFSVKPTVHKLHFAERIKGFLPLMVTGWLAGVLVLSLRLLTGWMQIKRLKRVATSAVDQVWHGKLGELGRRLGMNHSVRLLQSALVEVPTVIGWLRPVILLPASCLVRLSPAQLEAILAHELAHIRRHDYLVNLLQSVVETFLFYHPAVWWVSRCVREERELCCDDLAVEICGDRIAYARALATLEALRAAPAQLALAAGGAPLLQRIRRLAGQPRGSAQRPAWPVAGIFVLIIMATLAVGIRGNRVQARAGEEPSVNVAANQVSTNQTNIPLVRDLLNHRTPPPPHIIPTYPGQRIPASPGREALLSLLSLIHVDSVQYDNVPLGKVLNDLSGIAKSRDPDQIGINFLVDRQVAASGVAASIDPVTGLLAGWNSSAQYDATTVNIKINPALSNLCLADVLDAVVKGADRPIHYSVLEYAVKFESGKAPEPLETRMFYVKPSDFVKGVQLITGMSNAAQTALILPADPNVAIGTSWGNSSGGGGGGPQNLGQSFSSTNFILQQQSVRQFLSSVGMDLDTNNPANAGKSFVWNDRKGILLVRSTTNELDMVEAAITAINQSSASISSGQVSTNQTKPEPLETRMFHVEPNTFRHGLESVSFISMCDEGSAPVPLVISAPDGSFPTNSASIQALVKMFLLAIGAELNTNNPDNAGKSFVWNDRKGILLVRSTAQDLANIDAAIQALPAGPSQVDLKSKCFAIEKSNFEKFTDIPSSAGNLCGILRPEQFQTAVKGLELLDGVDEINFGEVTIESGRQAQIRADRLGAQTNLQAGTLVTGESSTMSWPVLDIVPVVSADEKTISLTLITSMKEFVGYDRSQQPYVGDFPDSGTDGNGGLASVPDPPLGIAVPHFRLRQLSNCVDVIDGQTIVLGKFKNLDNANTNNSADKEIIIFITPTIINADGTRAHPFDGAPATTNGVPQKAK